MPKAIFAIIAALLLLSPPGYSTDLVRSTNVKPRAMTGEEYIPNVPYYPSSPGTVCSPGDTVGFTQYDYQSNGSTGNRIVVDETGNVHVIWMNGDPYPSTRLVFFNCLTLSGWMWPGIGTSVSYNDTGDGYCQLDVTNDDRAVIGYHNARTGLESTYVAIDFSNCLGTFNYSHPTNRYGGAYYMWPYVAVDSNGYIHKTVTNNGTPQNILYSRSTDGGNNWIPLQVVGVSSALTQIIVSSPVSDKTCIAYTRDAHDVLVDTTTDLVYAESPDGRTWDFAHPVNVTNYGTDNDSLGVGWDIDAIYDYNDNLHLVWYSRWQTTASIYYLTHLYHYDVASGTITEIANTDSLWPSAGCTFGNYSWHFQKVSLAVNPNTSLHQVFVAYTDFDTSDCALSGYANGDIYGHMSTDDGATWTNRVNLTNSPTPGCFPGECDSDNWPSMAEKANDYLHILYINDKDAGAIPQTQGSVTDNPVTYLRTSISTFGVDEDVKVPAGYALAQNYPNPFNARTIIRFELPRPSHVSIEIYDILGRKVTTLLDEERPAGPQQVTWNADKYPSGIYSYRIEAGVFSQNKKMLLVK
jgi:hypothetical protein